MPKSKKTVTSKGSSRPARKSEIVSRPGAALKVEIFKLTDTEKKGLSLKGRLSDIKVYSDEEWEKIKKAA